MHSNGNSQMCNTTIYQRPATCKSSLKQPCITLDSGSFLDGLLRSCYLKWVSGTGGLEFAFIGGCVADNGTKYWAALQNRVAILSQQKQCLLCGEGNRNSHRCLVLCLDKEATSMGWFLSSVIGWNANEFCSSWLADILEIIRGEFRSRVNISESWQPVQPEGNRK